MCSLINTCEENKKYKINGNTLYYDIIKKFDKNFKLNLSNINSLIYPKFLEITFLNNLINQNEINKILNDVYLTMKVNGICIFNIPLKFLLHFNKFEIYKNKFYLDLSFDLFIEEILIPKSHYLYFIFELINVNNDIVSCNLIMRITHCFSFINNTRKNILQYLSSVQLNDINGRNYFEYKLPFNGIIKGLFIECDNINNINNLILTLNDNINIQYNHFLIKINCIKISDKLLYYPFNSQKKFNDLSNISFEGSINFNKIQNIKIIVNLTENINNLIIYALGTNIIKYKKNKCNLIFNYNFINIHIKQNYNESTIIPQLEKTIIYKLIIDENKNTCNINLEEIKINTKYMNCILCNNNFFEESLKNWLNIKKKCPLCRRKWLDYSIYINSDIK